MNRQFLLSCLARLIVGLLARSGVHHFIVSPGSRSTPYLAAALERVDLKVHLVVDERSAAYVALGLARATSQPVALLCTSGTATANYFPAIVEARLTQVPLIVLTADRPLSLQGCASPQTIDQTRLYGTHVVGTGSLTLPNSSIEEFRHLYRQILSVLALAQGVERGPVHLNLHTPKPLELLRADCLQERDLQTLIDALIAQAAPIVPPRPPRLDERAIDLLYACISGEPRGVITCGFDPLRHGLDSHELARFARVTGYPILVDVAHPLRSNCSTELRPHLVAPFEPLLRSDEWRKLQTPKLVIQIGRPLISAVWEQWLNQSEPNARIERVLLLADSGWPDPSGRAEHFGLGDLNDTLARVSALLEAKPPRANDWSARWLRASEVVRNCIDTWAQCVAGSEPSTWGELRAVMTVLAAQTAEARLIVGNSLPVRELDLLAPLLSAPVHSEALRGASGIDGVVSTAVGFALANDRPTTLLVGDISFLHDIGALWPAREIRSPLAIVVLNNGGGRIFEQLPVAHAVSPEHLAYWTTPQRLDLSAAARLYGLPYRRAECRSELSESIAEAYSRPSTTLIEVPLEADSAIRQTKALLALVFEALRQGNLPGRTVTG